MTAAADLSAVASAEVEELAALIATSGAEGIDDGAGSEGTGCGTTSGRAATYIFCLICTYASANAFENFAEKSSAVIPFGKATETLSEGVEIASEAISTPVSAYATSVFDGLYNATVPANFFIFITVAGMVILEFPSTIVSFGTNKSAFTV